MYKDMYIWDIKNFVKNSSSCTIYEQQQGLNHVQFLIEDRTFAATVVRSKEFDLTKVT